MKPILFNTEMVQAILKGKKTQTRRVMKPQPIIDLSKAHQVKIPVNNGNISSEQYITINSFTKRKAKYQVGDILWVRETWAIDGKLINIYTGQSRVAKYNYRADWNWNRGECRKWKPSIHMPKEAARIFLEVINVRVERLNDITEKDAKAEGISYESAGEFTFWSPTANDPDSGGIPNYKNAFLALWDSIYKDKGFGWDTNPFVWVYEFKKVEVSK
jgi:hypothetical protein